jgi:hypothetical protein
MAKSFGTSLKRAREAHKLCRAALRERSWLQAGTVSVAMLLSPATFAAAPSADSASAQVLFDEGKKLMADGKFAEACPKLEESQRLDPTSGTLINLAACYEQQGLTATAWAAFLDAATAANRAGNPKREKEARDRAAALVPRLSKIVITVTGSDKVEGVEVKRDSTTIGKAQWGAGMPADQGLHKVTVTAPGRKTWEKDVIVKGGGETVTVQVPELEPGGPTPTESNGGLSGAGALSSQKIAALAVGGVGLVGVVVGSIFGLKAISKHNDAANYCDPLCHDQAGLDVKADAMHASNISTVAFVVGGAALGGAALLWFTDRTEKSIAPQVGIGPSGIVLKGAW